MPDQNPYIDEPEFLERLDSAERLSPAENDTSDSNGLPQHTLRALLGRGIDSLRMLRNKVEQGLQSLPDIIDATFKTFPTEPLHTLNYTNLLPTENMLAKDLIELSLRRMSYPDVQDWRKAVAHSQGYVKSRLLTTCNADTETLERLCQSVDTLAYNLQEFQPAHADHSEKIALHICHLVGDVQRGNRFMRFTNKMKLIKWSINANIFADTMAFEDALNQAVPSRLPSTTEQLDEILDMIDEATALEAEPHSTDESLHSQQHENAMSQDKQLCNLGTDEPESGKSSGIG